MLDPFEALIPYQKNLDDDLAVKNARPLVKVFLQQEGILEEQQPTVLMTQDDEIIGTE